MLKSFDYWVDITKQQNSEINYAQILVKSLGGTLQVFSKPGSYGE